MKTLLLLTPLLGLVACNEGKLRGTGKANAKQDRVSGICEVGLNASRTESEITTINEANMIVSGEFCTVDLAPPQQAALNVIFITDHSGSMAFADQSLGTTCGRMDAVSAVLQRIVPPGLTDPSGNPPNVNVGAISFGSSANVDVPLTSITEFGTQVNAVNFCGDTKGQTNYEDAFVTAADMIKTAQGPKVVYFLTDGFPSASGTNVFTQGLQNLFSGSGGFDEEPYTKGVEGAQRLLSIPETSLNVVFLEESDPTLTPDPLAPNPQQYLTQIAGNDPNRVKIAQNASSLAQQIVLLDTPDPTNIEEENITAILSADGMGTRKVKVRPPEQIGPGKWRFETHQFPLFVGASGQTVTQQLTVSALTRDPSVSPQAISIFRVTRTGR